MCPGEVPLHRRGGGPLPPPGYRVGWAAGVRRGLGGRALPRPPAPVLQTLGVCSWSEQTARRCLGSTACLATSLPLRRPPGPLESAAVGVATADSLRDMAQRILKCFYPFITQDTILSWFSVAWLLDLQLCCAESPGEFFMLW